MLKAVIFDDAPIVIKGLQQMIDWSKYGIEIVGSATDGNTAMDVVKKKQPEIIFTDIRMPGLDGLQLIEYVMDVAPETICVVFSGFKEYDYVKKALKLGVIDYLEKPITIKNIEEVIVKTLNKIEEQKQSELSQTEQLERAMIELLFKGDKAEGKWQKQIDQISLNPILGVTVLSSTKKLSWKDGDQTTYFVQELYLENYYIYVILEYDILTSYSEILADELDLVKAIIGVGRTSIKKEGITRSYNESVKALRYGQYMNLYGFYYYEQIKSEDYISDDNVTIISKIREGVTQLDRESVLQYFDSYIKMLENKWLEPDIVEREVLKVIYMVIETVQEKGLAKSKYLFMNYFPHVEIRQIKTKEEMKEWFRLQIEGIMAGLNNENMNIHPSIKQAIDYIEKNFGKSITLSEVSEQVDMNPTYFSYLFKEELGLSYIKYLTDIRIEKAKKMLEKGEKVTEVSEKVGYHTYRHFSEVFKKKVGVSPGQYKK
ncbi:response regulator [Aquibacillus albus]|uniref:Two-component system response regulator YesN n=1 Tax=Aquibacillus albus TaxID=1168171 RepID=A0ABS2N4G7_9BACI|nr:two-component system response regulator YesN [Aquibacillus albus]